MIHFDCSPENIVFTTVLFYIFHDRFLPKIFLSFQSKQFGSDLLQNEAFEGVLFYILESSLFSR